MTRNQAVAEVEKWNEGSPETTSGRSGNGEREREASLAVFADLHLLLVDLL